MATNRPLILIIDDEPHLCNALSRILEKGGYEVMSALNGKSGLQIAKEKTPDVILLDIMMPGINGTEVCRQVRKFSPTTRIIYFTAKVELAATLKLRTKYAGADAFIVKPATSRRILSKVNRVLSSRH